MVQALAAPLATALGGGVVATAVSQIAVGVALSYVANAVFAPKAPEIEPALQQSATVGALGKQRVILGTVATFGHWITLDPYCHDNFGVAVGSNNSGQYLSYAVHLSDIPVHQLRSVIIQGTKFDIGTHLIDEGSPAGLNVPAGLADEFNRYRGKVWIKFYDGTQTAADPYMRTVFGNHPERPWTADMVNIGGAYAVVHVKYDRELWQDIRNFRWVIDGAKVDNGNFTNNPVKLAAAIAAGIALPSGDVYGPQTPFDPSYLAAAVAASDAAGFRAGLEVQVGGHDGGGITSLDAIERLLEACAGRAWDDGGVLRVTALDGGLPVASITDDDILTDQSQSAEKVQSLERSVNSVTISHPNADELFVVKPSATQTLAGVSGADRKPQALTFPAILDEDQAQKIAGMLVKDAQGVRVHTFALPLSYGYLTLQDKIAWTSQDHSYSSKVFRIEAIMRAPTYTLVTVRETDPADFDPQQVTLVPYTPIQATVTNPAPIVTVPTFTPAQQIVAGRPLRAGVTISIASAPAVAEFVEFEIRILGQTDVVRGNFATGNLSAFVPLQPNTSYEGRTAFVTDERTTPFSAWTPFTTGAIQIPPADLDANLVNEISTATSTADQAAADALAIEQGLLGQTEDYLLGPNGEISIGPAGIVFDGSTLTLGAGVFQGQVSASMFTAGSARNLLDNTRFKQLVTDGQGGFGAFPRPLNFGSIGSGSVFTNATKQVFQDDAGPILQVTVTKEAAPTGLADIRSYAEGAVSPFLTVTSVEAEQWYMFSHYTDFTANTDIQQLVAFYDKAGGPVGTSAYSLTSPAGSNGDPTLFPRRFTPPLQAPVGAAYATVILRHNGNTDGASTGTTSLWSWKWQFEQVTENTQEPGPYADGSVSVLSPDGLVTEKAWIERLLTNEVYVERLNVAGRELINDEYAVSSGATAASPYDDATNGDEFLSITVDRVAGFETTINFFLSDCIVRPKIVAPGGGIQVPAGTYTITFSINIENPNGSLTLLNRTHIHAYTDGQGDGFWIGGQTPFYVDASLTAGVRKYVIYVRLDNAHDDFRLIASQVYATATQFMNR